MSGLEKYPSLLTAACTSMLSILLVSCNFSESGSPGPDVPAGEKPDPKVGAVGSVLYTQRFLRQGENGTLVPATAPEFLGNLSDAAGVNLGLQAGDKISFHGMIGNEIAPKVTPLTYAEGASGTTLQELLDKLRESLALPERDGTAGNHLSVAVNPPGSEDGIPDGAIVIRGRPGKAFSISGLSVQSTDSDNQKPSPNYFNTNMNVTTYRKAADSALTGAE